MAVLVLKTGDRCKFCTSPHRQEIDLLLERRGRGEEDDQGRRINEAYVLARLAEWGVPNPTPDNIKSHWGKTKHSFWVEGEQEQAVAQAEEDYTAAAMEVFERILGPDWRNVSPSPEQLLELQRALFPIDLLRKIKSGQSLGITWDQLDRGINTATRRHHEEKVDDLIGSLAGAIEQSAVTAGKAIDALAAPSDEPLEAEAAEVVEELPPGD